MHQQERHVQAAGGCARCGICDEGSGGLRFRRLQQRWGLAVRCLSLACILTTPRTTTEQQARYIVERSDADLWLSVLGDDNKFRRQLVDQVC